MPVPQLTIRALDISVWAESVRARSLLPVLIRRLIHETFVALVAIDFPGHDEAQRPGWDGWTEASTGNAWVPTGSAGWELSVADDNPGKPNRDWSERVTLPAEMRAVTTFLFVTARRWPGKTRWLGARRKEAAWADVRAYDAEDLAQWLEQSPATRLWFVGELGRPAEGLCTLDTAWNGWANACLPPLSAKLFEEAVTAAATDFATWRSAAPHRPFVVAADSVGEAVAFVAAALDVSERERAIVVEDVRALPGVLTAGSASLVVIADPRAEAAAATAAGRNHIIFARTHVTVPVEVNVALGPTSHTTFEAALADMGIPENDRDRITTEAGRSPTILRRQLAIAPELRVPHWARDPVLHRKLVPILLAGAWRVKDKADEACVVDLAGKPIEEIDRDVAELAAFPDAPVWSAAGFCGVVSRKDALFALHHALTEQDIARFLAVAELVLMLDDPRLNLPEEERWAAGIYGVQAEVSGALREAIGELLVLLAIEGDRLLGDRLGPISTRVDRVVAMALKDATPRRWRAQHHLRWLAEASPDAFLDAVEADLLREEPALFSLLRPVTSSMGGCDRTELLWALELLAWEPRRFPRVFALLARLSEVPINDNWMNKPEASLGSLVRYWLPQTAASVDERIAVLQSFAKTRSPIVWRLLIAQFPRLGHAIPNMRPRWREVKAGASNRPSYEEAQAFVLAALELLIGWPDYSTEQLGDLFDLLDDFPDEAVDKLLERAEHWADSASDADRAIVRDRLRRSFGLRHSIAENKKESAAWEGRLNELVTRLAPSDPVERHRWLFAGYWPQYERDTEESWEQRAVRIERDRSAALQEVLDTRGIDGVISLIAGGNAASWLGSLLAKLDGERIGLWLRVLLTHGEIGAKADDALRGLIGTCAADVRRSVLIDVLSDAALSIDDRLRVMLAAPAERATWQLVEEDQSELAACYWRKALVHAHGLVALDTTFMIDQLLGAGRPFAAFQALGHVLDTVDPALLARVLRAMRGSQGDDIAKAAPDGWQLGEAIAYAAAAKAMSPSELASLEFTFFTLLDHHYQQGTPHLDRALADNPSDFVYLITLIYKRDDGQVERKEGEEASARTAWRVLHRGRRVPGTTDTGAIDAGALITWIDRARELGRAAARSTMTDQTIGTLLAAAPVGADGHWPHEAVRSALDHVAAEHVAIGFIVGKRNARGVVTRSPGGGQERALAAGFRTGADEMRIAFPFTARALERLAEDYEHEARRWDGEVQVDRRLGRR